ncbi:MAG: ribose 5-phosphate isomerase B [Clostridiales bacterium]|jgi:ribose 5-phosphate isomerase B|nr:ribose 5-phosphate isomerase B [Clostridiales bacterium]
MKIAVGSDHAALPLKAAIVAVLEQEGHEVLRFGYDTPQPVDYPDVAAPLCAAVNRRQADRGILICGTGIGMSIAANKVNGIRAAVCGDTFSARMTRAHNDANVLCLGARVLGEGLALDIVATFLSTPFEGGRHAVRVDKVMRLEGKP